MFLPLVSEIGPTEFSETTLEVALPLGTCEHCGADYFDGHEELYHYHAECIGAEERYNSRFEF